MHTVHQPLCGVIPPHILTRVAPETLDQMRELASARSHRCADRSVALAAKAAPSRVHRGVYDGKHHIDLPGKLVRSDHKTRGGDREVGEAWDGSGDTWEFFARVFGRDSIDGRGMRIDSTVHDSRHFDNAMWTGEQMVYGDGDGVYFNRFTIAKEVIGHELTHGITQYSAGLGYFGQNGALNEHLSDAFGVMVKQYTYGQTVHQADWLIGAGLFTRKVDGVAIRSMAAPGTAYDDPVLGTDPQPDHMNGYVDTDDDNGGVHINSGIPNHAFYLAAMAIGGKSWNVMGKVWYRTLTERLQSDDDFAAFASATVDVAGALYGTGGSIQRIVAEAWAEVGLPVPLFATCTSMEGHVSRRVRIHDVQAVPPVMKPRRRA